MEVFNTHNINDIYDNFTKVYNHYVDKNIPKKVVTIQPSDKPFMTIVRLIGEKIAHLMKKAPNLACWYV